MTTPKADHAFGRVIGILMALSFALGVYALRLDTGAANDADALARLPGGAGELSAAFRLDATLSTGLAALGALAAFIEYRLPRDVAGRPAGVALLLRAVNVALVVGGAFIALRLAALFAGSAEGPQDLSALVDRAGPLVDLDWKAFHYGLALSSLAAAINYALMFRGRYVPRALAGYGLLASMFVTGSIAAMEIHPQAGDYVYPAYAIGNGVAFVATTLWLLVRGFDSAWWKSTQPR